MEIEKENHDINFCQKEREGETVTYSAQKGKLEPRTRQPAKVHKIAYRKNSLWVS